MEKVAFRKIAILLVLKVNRRSPTTLFVHAGEAARRIAHLDVELQTQRRLVREAEAIAAAERSRNALLIAAAAAAAAAEGGTRADAAAEASALREEAARAQAARRALVLRSVVGSSARKRSTLRQLKCPHILEPKRCAIQNRAKR